jgi:hypothetical protein
MESTLLYLTFVVVGITFTVSVAFPSKYEKNDIEKLFWIGHDYSHGI